MKFDNPISLEDAASFLGCKFVGNPSHQISGLNEIHKVVSGDLVFVDFKKYYDKALNSEATTILIDKEVDCPDGKGLLISDQPFDDFNRLIKRFSPVKPWDQPRGENVSIGPDSAVHVNVTIGNNVIIGNGCTIYPGAVIYDNVIIGDNVIVHGNVVLGSHAFYYKKKETGYDRMITCGRVILEDNVEIGAGSTIDAGVTGDTVIGQGTKFDNNVHIGHDTVVGKNCLFAAQVGVAGCVTIEDNVTLWGQVGVVSDITIQEGVTVYGQSGVGRTLEAGKTYFGSPAAEAREKFKELAAIRKLPIIIERL